MNSMNIWISDGFDRSNIKSVPFKSLIFGVCGYQLITLTPMLKFISGLGNILWPEKYGIKSPNQKLIGRGLEIDTGKNLETCELDFGLKISKENKDKGKQDHCKI